MEQQLLKKTIGMCVVFPFFLNISKSLLWFYELIRENPVKSKQCKVDRLL